MEGKKAKESRKGALKCVSLGKKKKTVAEREITLKPVLQEKARDRKQENQKMHIVQSENSCGAQLETLTE